MSIKQTYGSFFDNIDRTKGILVGGMLKGGQRSDFSLIMHLDPKAFSKAVGRLEVYKQIPRKAAYFLDDAGGYIVHKVIPRMFDEGDEGEWSPLRESTLNWRERMGYAPGPILKASGSLFYEMTGAQTAIDEIVTGKYNRVVIGGNRLHGVNKIKFKVHMGGGHGWHGSVIPARPFIPQSVNDLTKEEQKTLSRKFRDHMSEMESLGKGYRGRMFKWK